MNVERVIAELSSQYPGKTVAKLPPDNPSEIICEIEPTVDHSERSVVIAVIDSSYPHFHHRSNETYEVLKGKVSLYVGNTVHILKEGDKYTVEPGNVHWATADSAWVRVESVPGWTPKDHILVINPKE